jgi:lipoate-protein ligase B
MIRSLVFAVASFSINEFVFAFHVPYFTARDLSRRKINLAPQQLGEFESINKSDEDRAQRRVWLYDYVSSADSTTVPYNVMWEQQKSLVNDQLTRIGKGPKDPPLYDQFVPMEYPRSLTGCDSVIMVEHDPVYTLGTASDASFIHGYQASDDNNEEVKLSGNDNDIIPIVRIERGGEVTYHGPGQLVVYPIIDLRGYNQDIHWYMRALEEVIIIALKKAGIKEVSIDQCSHSLLFIFDVGNIYEKIIGNKRG